MRALVLGWASLVLMGCATASTDILSDGELVSRASVVLNSQQSPPDRILGIHRGAQVIVEERCGDVCPAYTIRIVHYMTPPGAACSAIGGDTAAIPVPAGIAVMNQDFCIPHVLYQRKLYTGHPFQK